ncbi:MAG: hypothetical protein L3J26_13070 [Candidatus Polarisedimenticolaceae bacterium]|nr:hypothetical protein [Candidatus Polarisedimenticolaceae bacterium]
MRQQQKICPVCSMKVNPDVPTAEHHKIHYYFCSEQCRETFSARPSFYIKTAGSERKEHLKRRTIRLAKTPDEAVMVLLASCLSEMMGVKEVAVEGKKIQITYDLLQTTEIQIEKTLDEIGVQLGDGWLERLRRGWVNESEEVALDNLTASGKHCCNKPPPGI